MSSHQSPIKATAHDAILSKLSAYQLGYYDDPFLPYMATNASGLTSSTSSNGRPIRVFERRDSPHLNSVPPRSSSGNSTNNIHIPPSPPIVSGPRLSNQFEVESFRSYINSERRMSTPHIPPRQQDIIHPHPFSNPVMPKRLCNTKRQLHPAPHIQSQIAQKPQSGQMHQPVIRRGTHARVCVMDYAITTFLSLCKDVNEVQVVILGSGRDTSYLRSQCNLLHDKTQQEGKCNRIKGNVRWYEVDHPSMIQEKHDLLLSCDLFDFNYQKIMNGIKDESYIISPKNIRTTSKNDDENVPMQGDESHDTVFTLEPYHLIGYDLRNAFDLLLKNMVENHSFNVDCPTLFVMECVQMYLPDADSRRMLETITAQCHHGFMAIFDPIIQHDQFGQVMAQNLTKAKIADKSMSLLNTRTLKEQVDKLKSCGFDHVTGCDFYSAYEMLLTMEDRRRANQAEMLDEIEEWMLIMKHYCFLVASCKKNSDEKNSGGIEEAYCSVVQNNPFGFVASKCLQSE